MVWTASLSIPEIKPGQDLWVIIPSLRGDFRVDIHPPVLAMEIFDDSYSILSYGFSFGLVSWLMVCSFMLHFLS